MTTVRQLHHEAMLLAEDVKFAQDAGQHDEARALAAQAFKLERQAVSLVPKEIGSEPTRSILCLSAGWLALDAGLHIEAERILGEGLSGYPADKTRAELYEALDQVMSEMRRGQLTGDERPARLNLRLHGGAVSFGRAPVREVTSRMTAAESMLERWSLMAQNLPWPSSGRISAEQRPFDTYVRAFAPGSLEVELELAFRHMAQLRLEDDLPSPEAGVTSIIAGLQSVQENDMVQLALIYPDPAYLRHFVTKARELAPDGEVIQSVDIHGANRSLEFTRPQGLIDLPRINELETELIRSVPLHSTGKLVAGDISSKGRNRDTVKLEFPDGRSEQYKVAEGLEELVKDHFGREVTLELQSSPGQRLASVIDVKPVVAISDE